MKLSKILIYPIKSMGGVSLKSSAFDRKGLLDDRRWMLIDAEGKFVTQRDFPMMAAFKVRVSEGGLKVTSPGGETLAVPREPDAKGSVGVAVWGSRCRGDLYGPAVGDFFSGQLGIAVRLVKISDERRRAISRYYSVHPEDEVSFADGYPFLIAGRNSLAELNSRLDEPIEMDRFRPNFVVSQSEPFAEDSWRRIRIGSEEFHVVKPCARCAVTTIDQDTGESRGPEPLKELAEFRMYKRAGKSKLLFGQNLISEKAVGVVEVGDEICVLETKRPPKLV